jgi:hypothetical protein
MEAPPPAEPQVIHIAQPAGQKMNLKEDYATKAATILGSLHLLCGLLTLVFILVYGLYEDKLVAILMFVGPEILCFFISGGLAIGGARSGTRCLVMATFVMAIISAVSAGSLLIWTSIMINEFGVDEARWGMAILFMQILTCLAMLAAGITTAVLTFRPLFGRTARAVHYTPATAGIPA